MNDLLSTPISELPFEVAMFVACFPCWIIVLIGTATVIKVAYEVIKELLSK